MNGKAALVARVLEAVRQRALTNRLGQVTCGDSNSFAARRHEFWHELGYSCLDCGAAV